MLHSIIARKHLFIVAAVLYAIAFGGITGVSAADDRVAKAIKEGQLVVYSSIFETPETQNAHREAYIKYWGLPKDFDFKWDIRSTPSLLGAIEAEVSAGKIFGDVTTMPAIAWFIQAVDRGLIMAYDSPEYKHFKLPERIGLNNRPYWVSDMYMYVPIWNSKEMPGLEIKSWMDFLKPELKGKMCISDGSVQQSAALMFWNMKKKLPADYYKRLAAQDVKVYSTSMLGVEMMMSGERPVIVSGISADANLLYSKGADFVRTSVPKEGVMLQEQTTCIFKDAPHPNAAKLWIDFLRSHEGQVIFEKMEGRVPGREGVPSSSPMTPNADELGEAAFAPDYGEIVKDPSLVRRAQQEFGEIFGRR